MYDLLWYQYGLIAIIFIWSGFVRSGLGFGGSVLSLPFMLLVDNRPLVYLPLISVHLLFFASITILQNQRKLKKQAGPASSPQSSIDWSFLKYAMTIMIIPKIVGVLGLITLPAKVMSAIIFSIVSFYSLTYIFNRPFHSKSRALDFIFLILGAYISGTSLIGGPLLIAVFATHVAREQLRDTLFALWIMLVTIKMAAFIIAGIDLQLIQHLWLLPCATIGHLLGLRLHKRLLEADPKVFYRLLGSVLLVSSIAGLWKGLA